MTGNSPNIVQNVSLNLPEGIGSLSKSSHTLLDSVWVYLWGIHPSRIVPLSRRTVWTVSSPDTCHAWVVCTRCLRMVHAPTTSLEHRVEFPRAMALSTMNNRIVPQLRGTTTRGSFYVVRNGFHGNKCMHFHRMQQQQDSSTMRTTHFLTICVVETGNEQCLCLASCVCVLHSASC